MTEDPSAEVDAQSESVDHSSVAVSGEPQVQTSLGDASIEVAFEPQKQLLTYCVVAGAAGGLALFGPAAALAGFTAYSVGGFAVAGTAAGAVVGTLRGRSLADGPESPLGTEETEAPLQEPPVTTSEDAFENSMRSKVNNVADRGVENGGVISAAFRTAGHSVHGIVAVATDAATLAKRPFLRVTKGSEPTASDSAEAEAALLRSPEQFEQLLRKIEARLATAASSRWRWGMGATIDAETNCVVEEIRAVAEVIAWGERHDTSLFDTFCERRTLGSFVDALRSSSTPTVVKVQVLQTLSMLVQIARRKTSFYYLLSGGQLSELCRGDFLSSDEELVSWFVTFLKSVAMRLESDTAQLFLRAPARASSETPGAVPVPPPPTRPQKEFPLFLRAVELADFHDSLVRTSARAVILTLLKLESDEVHASLMAGVESRLAPALAESFRQVWNSFLIAATAGACALRSFLDLEEELLGFLAELLASTISDSARECISRTFLAVLLPQLSGLLRPLPNSSSIQSALVSPGAAASARLATACVSVLGSHGCVMEPLARALLWPHLPEEVVALISEHSTKSANSAVAALRESLDEGSRHESLTLPSLRSGLFTLLGCTGTGAKRVDCEDGEVEQAQRPAQPAAWLVPCTLAALFNAEGLSSRVKSELGLDHSGFASRIMFLLRPQARLPPEAQRQTAWAIVSLRRTQPCGPCRRAGPWPRLVGEATKEAGRMLLAVADGAISLDGKPAEDNGGSPGSTEATEAARAVVAVAGFLRAWSDHAEASARNQLENQRAVDALLVEALLPQGSSTVAVADDAHSAASTLLTLRSISLATAGSTGSTPLEHWPLCVKEADIHDALLDIKTAAQLMASLRNFVLTTVTSSEQVAAAGCWPPCCGL